MNVEQKIDEVVKWVMQKLDMTPLLENLTEMKTLLEAEEDRL